MGFQYTEVNLLTKEVAVLIDNMYVQHVASAFGFGVDYPLDIKKFSLSLLEKDEELYEIYVFDSLPFLPKKPTAGENERHEKKYKYLDGLKYLDRVKVEEGYVKPKKWICKECNTEYVVPVQKAVDVKLSVRLITLAWSNNIEIIALVAGDGDFKPAVNALEDSRTVVRLYYAKVGNTGVSKKLMQACNEGRELKPENFNFRYTKQETIVK